MLTRIRDALYRWRVRRSLARRAWPLFVALSFCLGCAGAERHARTALDVAARAVVVADTATAIVYQSRAETALAEATSLDDYRARMAPLDRAEVALRTTRESLLAAEGAIDASSADGWYGAVACAASALVDLVDALVAAGVDPPDALRKAIAKMHTVEGLAETLCRRGQP